MNKDRTYQLRVSNLAIDVVKKKIKNMHLKVYPAGRVRISAPLRVKDEAIRRFALSKLAWIEKQRLNFIRQVPEPKPGYVSGESHYFLGKRYLLKVLYHDAPPKVDISNESHILLYVREESDLERRESVMQGWYRAKLKEVAPPLIEKWQKVIGVQVRDWGVKKMKTRWGSCNVKARRVWLNLELAKKPPHCLDFIILHEMIHLLERTHSHQFKFYLDKFMPPWRQYKEELNRSRSLFTYHQTPYPPHRTESLHRLFPMEELRQR